MDPLHARLQSALGAGYVISRELGGGGMSRVFLAEETALGRRVVIKVLPPELSAGFSAERFRREIRLAAQLQHPHIVPVLQAGESDDLLYYTMPYVEGESLRALLARQGALPVADARRIACELLDALVYAHAQGVVHRDIKPDNVLISGHHAVVTDFGVAKALSSAAAGGSTTASGITLGTPAYMAPEQVAADPNTDHRADIYSFGALLYEMLSGRPPFIAGSPQALLAAQLTQPPEPITRHRSAVPPEVASQVMACLEKNPADRPQSAALLLRDFQGMPSAGGADHTMSIGARRRVNARLAGAVVLALVIAIAAYAASASRARRTSVPVARSVVVLPFVNVGGDSADEYFSDGMADELATAITRIPSVSVASRSSAFAFKHRRDSLSAQQIGQQLNVAYVVEGSIQHAGDRMRLSVQLVNVADNLAKWSHSYVRDKKDVLEVQEEIAQSIAGALRVQLVGGANELVDRPTADITAYDLYLKGVYAWNQRTGASLAQAVRYFEEAVARDSDFARAHAGVAESYVVAPFYSPIKPAVAWPKAKAAAERALGLDSTLVEARVSLAYGKFLYERDFAAAEQTFRQVIAASPRYATAYQWYADMLGGQGRIDERLRELKVAQKLDPLSRIFGHEIAQTLFGMGRVDEAIAQITQTLELDPTFATAYRTLGLLHVRKGMRESGIGYLRKSLDLSGRRAIDVAHLARVYALGGERDSARALVDELQRRARTEYVPAFAFAILYSGTGNIDRAFESLATAEENRDPSLAENWFDPSLATLHTDPRWAALLERIGVRR